MSTDTPMYDEIPMDIIEAAGAVVAFCNDRGYREFTICGMASPTKTARLERDLATALDRITRLTQALQELVDFRDSKARGASPHWRDGSDGRYSRARAALGAS